MLAFVLCDVLPFSGALDATHKADPEVKDLRKGFALPFLVLRNAVHPPAFAHIAATQA